MVKYKLPLRKLVKEKVRIIGNRHYSKVRKHFRNPQLMSKEEGENATRRSKLNRAPATWFGTGGEELEERLVSLPLGQALTSHRLQTQLQALPS